MSPREIEQRVVEALRTLPPDQSMGVRQLRSIVGCVMGDLSKTISRMRNQGKIAWDVIALKPGMRIDTPIAEQPVAEQVRREADQAGARRHSARQFGTIKRQVADLSVNRDLAAQVQEQIGADPQSLLRAIRRTHAASWDRVVALARGAGERPAETLYRVLDLGLDLSERQLVQDEAA